METKKPTHIFIVDNDRIFVRMLDYIFSKNIGYRFLDFKSGEDCLQNMDLNPELIVIDYNLPGMNGFETMQEIKEHNPEMHVLMLSGEKDRKLPAELLNGGADDHVLKDGNEIDRIVEKVEAFLTKDQAPSTRGRVRRPRIRKKLYYTLLAIALLLSLGYYYYI